MIVRCLDLLKRMCSFIRHSFILTGRTDIYFTEAVLIVNPTPVDLRFVVASSGRMCIRFPLPSKNPHRRIGFRWAQRIGITTLAATSILPCDHMVPVLSGSLLTFHIPKINGFFFCLDIWFVRPQWDEVASRGNVTRHFEGKDLFADLFLSSSLMWRWTELTWRGYSVALCPVARNRTATGLWAGYVQVCEYNCQWPSPSIIVVKVVCIDRSMMRPICAGRIYSEKIFTIG